MAVQTEELKIKVNANEVDVAAKKVEKAALALQILRGEAIQANGRVVNLGQGFTKSQSNMLAALKVMGATNQQLKEMARIINQVNSISKVNPFDGASDPLLKAKKATDELAKGLERAAKYGDLTKKQLEEVGRAAAFAQQKAAAMFGTGREAFGKRQAFAKQYVADIVEQFRRQNELNRSVEEKNRIEKEARARQEVEAKKAKLLQERMSREARAGDEMVRLFRKQEEEKLAIANRSAQRQREIEAGKNRAIQNELAKLTQQRDALSGGSRAATGNVMFRLTQAGATKEQIAQARALRQEIEKLSSTQSALRGLQGVLRGLIPAIGALSGGALFATGARLFVETADAIQLLSNRIQILSNNTVEFGPAFARLKEIADTSRTPIMELGTLYARLIPVMQSAGQTADYAQEVTRAFALAMTISGTTAQEARSGLLQFSQAMSSATFNGDEFRAISEAVPEVLRVLEKQLGVTRAELRKMSADGKLTSDIVGKALVDSIGELEERVKSAPLTLSQSTTLLNNEFKVLAKNIDDTFKITQGMTAVNKFFADMMNFVNENKEVLGTLREVMNAVLIVAVAKAVTMVGSLVAKLTKKVLVTNAANIAAMRLSMALSATATAAGIARAAFTGIVALLGGPWVAGIAAVTAGVYALNKAFTEEVATIEQLKEAAIDYTNKAVQLADQRRKAYLQDSAALEQVKLAEQQYANQVGITIQETERAIRVKELALMRAESHRNGLLNEGRSAASATEEVRKLRAELEELQKIRDQLKPVDHLESTLQLRNKMMEGFQKEVQASERFVENLRLQAAGIDPERLAKYTQQMAELNKQVETARSLNIPVDMNQVNERVRQLQVEAGLVKDNTRANTRSTRDAVNNFDNIVQKVNELYVEVTGATKNLTEAEKLRNSLLTDDRFKKLTQAQRQSVLARLEEIEAIEKQNDAERKAKEFLDKRNAGLSDIYDTIQSLNPVYDIYGGFLEKINNLELEGLITIEEATKALNEYARARINLANQGAVELVTEREQEVQQRGADIEHSRNIFGMTDSAKSVYEKQLEVVRKLQEDIERLKKIEGADPAVIQSQIEKLNLIAAQNNALIEQEENLKRVQDQSAKFAEIFTNAFDGLIFKGESFKDVIGDLERQIMRLITQILVLEPLEASLRGVFQGGLGSSGGIEGFLGSAVSSFFGGFFADGGRPPTNKVSVVGEKGPELFVPDRAGTIIPNHVLNKSSVTNNNQNITIVQNFTIQGQPASRETQAQIASRALQGAQVAIARNM